jgi:hypothetical protein
VIAALFGVAGGWYYPTDRRLAWLAASLAPLAPLGGVFTAVAVTEHYGSLPAYAFALVACFGAAPGAAVVWAVVEGASTFRR